MIKGLIALWERYERHISAAALALGFFFDLVVADRPDSFANNLLLLFYLVLAALLIVVLNLRQTRQKELAHSAEPLFLLLVLQFCFGGLASNLLVLYGRSGTFVGSALFLAMLAALLVGNEFLKSRYAQLRFNIGVYYLLLLSYCVIVVPVFITHTIGTWVFLFSGIISLVLMAAFLAAIFFFVFRGKDTRRLFGVSSIVLGIFLVFNVLYFVNIIPPVPLSLKNIGLYHSLLKRSSGDYLALYEKPLWYEFWRDTGSIYTLGTGASAFCFSSVFAPTNLTAPVLHRWEKYEAGEWVLQARVAFPIQGGRNEGYRGFSVKSALAPGRWRCSVETQGGALIGRIGFTVIEATTTPALSQKVL